MSILGAVISLLVTAVAFFILSKLPIGVEIDSFGKAIISAIIFGVLNFLANFFLYNPVSSILTIPANFLSLGLFSFIVNVIIFGLTALLVEGFRLRWGFISAIIGAFALGIINSLIHNFLPNLPA